jgi:beta-barrel assembly-enhancing protease
MNNSLYRRTLALALAAVLLLLPMRPAFAFLEMFSGELTIEKERQLGEEFFLQLQQYVPLVEDPYLNSYINRLGQRLAAQMGPQPFKYKFYIINDPSINAFAVPGGYVFVHTGIIRSMEHEGELAAVLAHEISHVYARHVAKSMEKAKITNITALIGALAAIFLGAGPLAEPLMVGSMAAGSSAMLKYSRDFEQEADGLGFKWMSKAGYNPQEMITVFKKMGRQRWFEGGKVPIYLSTHPDVESRLVDLAGQIKAHEGQLPTVTDSPEFHFFTIRLEAITGNPHQLLRRMEQDGAREPQNPLPHYGKAMALAKLERSDEAIAEFQQALKLSSGNPLVQKDLAIHYFSRNRYLEAQQLLDDLSRRTPQDDVILFYLGRICQERKQVDKALPLFEKVYNLNPTFTEVYFSLGTLYGEKGQIGLAHYFLGFYSLRSKAYPTALFHFKKALANLSPGDTRAGEVKRQVTRLEKLRVRVVN